jgi:hypothetical protein
MGQIHAILLLLKSLRICQKNPIWGSEKENLSRVLTATLAKLPSAHNAMICRDKNVWSFWNSESAVKNFGRLK